MADTLCPVCGSQQTFNRLTVDSEHAAAHFIAPAENPTRYAQLAAHIAKLWEGKASELTECRDCSFGFSEPFVPGDQKFYSLAYLRSDYPHMKWEYERTLSAWRPSGDGRRILEVGAGDGFFLDLVSPDRIERERIVATEYYEGAIDTLRGKGYSAIQGDVRTEVAQEEFSAIFMFQVLEHMGDLTNLFERLRALLAPGGDLFIAVPNKHRTQFNEDHGSLIDCPPNHIGRWTSKTFRTLAGQHGLEMVAAETEPFSLATFIKQDLYYSHRRRSQRNGSLAGWVRAIKSEKLRRVAIQAEAALMAPTRVPVWLQARSDGNLGNALWVHLRRPA